MIKKIKRTREETEKNDETVATTVDEVATERKELSALMPKKKFFRTRAHCNPLSHNNSFNYPLNPEAFDWQSLYPGIVENERSVRILDIGMGFGGLTVAMANLFPDKLVMGMEIRAKVCEYVRLRIEALRQENPGQYQNAACLRFVCCFSSFVYFPFLKLSFSFPLFFRTNCMRYLPNFFHKGQLEKIFICFPDPHFKAKNHRRRIISPVLLSEYAYLLQPKGRLYTITDVEELYQWHVAKCDAHPLFRRIDTTIEGFYENDAATVAMTEETEESKKVAKAGGKKFVAVYERIEDLSEVKQNPKLAELFR
jgi:tRNA (guanine-N7-)-methyltransferase